MTVEIDADRQEAFTRMIHDFHMGGTRYDLEVRARGADRQQGMASLRELVKVAQSGSDQSVHIARFLAGLYNGPVFPFDLIELRQIDDRLFEHVVAVLRMDHSPDKEVHEYFPDGHELWQKMIADWGLVQDSLKRAAINLSEFLSQSQSADDRELARDVAQRFKFKR